MSDPPAADLVRVGGGDRREVVGGEREAADDLGAVVDLADLRRLAGGEVDRVQAGQAGVGVGEDGEGGAVLADVEAVGGAAGGDAERADLGDDAVVRRALGRAAVDPADADERVVDEVDAEQRRQRLGVADGHDVVDVAVVRPAGDLLVVGRVVERRVELDEEAGERVDAQVLVVAVEDADAVDRGVEVEPVRRRGSTATSRTAPGPACVAAPVDVLILKM